MPEIKRIWVDKESDLQELSDHLIRLSKSKRGLDLAVDCETTGLDVNKDRMLGFSLCWSKQSAVWVDCKSIPDAAASYGFEIFRHATRLVGHNIYYFDRHFFERAGCPILGNEKELLRVHDTMIAAAVCGEWADEIGGKRSPLGLKTLSSRLLDYRQIEYQELFAELLPDYQGPLDFSLLPRHEMVLKYVTDDAWCTWMIACDILPAMEATSGNAFTYTLERQLAPYAQKIEQAGVRINTVFLALQANRLKNARTVLDQWLRDYAGLNETFNFNSAMDMQRLLYERMGLEVMERSKPSKRYPKGQPKTDEHTINLLLQRDKVPADCAPWLRNFQVLKAVEKSIGQYLTGLPEHVQEDGAIRCTYRQFGAASGRFSSSKPNLQNISRKEEWHVEGRIGCTLTVNVRECFIPRDGYYFLDSDYNAIEARIMASASQDPAYLEIFRRGGDIHYNTASLMFDIPPEEVSKEQRQRAKTVVYGWGFGQKVEQMAKRNNMTLQVTQLVYNRFVKTFAVLVDFRLSKIEEWHTRKGWAFTFFGRPRYLPEHRESKRFIQARGERSAFNHYVQGTAADIQKMALLRVAKMLEADYGGYTQPPEIPAARIVMHTHDSNLIEVHESIKPEDITPKIHKCMAVDLPPDWLPMKVDTKVVRSLG